MGNFEAVRLEQIDDDRHTAQPVNEWALKQGEDIPQLAANIDDVVFGDANVYGGNQYQLVAIANGKVRARMGIRAKVPEKAIQRSSIRQYADESAALFEQTYRHNEALMRAVINISVGNTKSLVAEIDRLHRLSEKCPYWPGISFSRRTICAAESEPMEPGGDDESPHPVMFVSRARTNSVVLIRVRLQCRPSFI